jgi:hypothetical protein
VRFVDKGINLSTILLESSDALPGLSQELKRNLDLQNSFQDELVVTDIYNGYVHSASVISTNQIRFIDDTLCFPTSDNIGLAIIFSFWVPIEEKENSNYTKFRRLLFFDLFTSHTSINSVNGKTYRIYEYVIDFGKDADGASRLISQVLQETDDISADALFNYYTNVGEESAADNRDKLQYAESNELTDIDSGRPPIIKAVLSYILFFILLFIGLYIWNRITHSTFN